MADTRDISMHFWATQEEYDLIQKNMALSGSTNLSAFLRKMAIDGMVIRLDMPPELRKAHQANDRAVMDAYGFTKGTAARTSESACVAELMKRYQQLLSAQQREN